MASAEIFEEAEKQAMINSLEGFDKQIQNIENLPIEPAKIEEREAFLKLLGLHIGTTAAEISCEISYAKFYEWYDKEYPNTY